MKDKELYDIFHAYRPEMSSDEEFMARLEEKMKAFPQPSPKESEPSRSGSPLLGRGRGRLRLFLPWLSGIAAVVAVGLFLLKPTKGTEPQVADIYPAYSERTALIMMNADPLASFEETVAEIEQSGQQLQLAIAEMKK